MKQYLFFLLTILLFATSCQKHLSKKNAKSQIMTEFKYPKVETFIIPKEFVKDWIREGVEVGIDLGDDDGGEWEEKLKMINEFEKSKLILFEETPHREETNSFLGATVKTWTEVKVSLTDEGKKHLISEKDKSFEVKLWETSIDAISEISEKDKIATVQYTISNKGITAFGKSFPDGNLSTQMTSFFSLQDNGWRIKEWGVPHPLD